MKWQPRKIKASSKWIWKKKLGAGKKHKRRNEEVRAELETTLRKIKVGRLATATRDFSRWVGH